MAYWAVTSEEMKKIEEKALEGGKLTLTELMERAGRAVAEEVMKEEPHTVTVVCGRGSNGGDGLVCARYLAEAGKRVAVFLLESTKLSSLSQENLNKLQGEEVVLKTGLKGLREALKKSDVIVDALFGFGFRGEMRSPYKECVEEVNKHSPRVISIDVPSGLDASTGKVGGECIKASKTVTFTVPKIGLLLYPGVFYAGKLVVKEIGIPREIVEDISRVEVSNEKRMALLIPQRSPQVHKWSVGSVFIIAGSKGMAGAAILAAKGALRMGAGIVKLALPRSINDIVQTHIPECLTLPLLETEKGAISLDSLPLIKEEISRFDVVLLGPGISRNGETQKLVNDLISWLEKPLVIDADALFALTNQPEVLKEKEFPVVLTPHPGELSRFFSVSSREIAQNPLFWGEKAVELFNSIVVLKGARTLVFSKEKIFLNLTGNPGLATAGTGDVLSGFISSLLAQGLSAFNASSLGVYLHGLAADIATSTLTEYAFIASDIFQFLPKAILKLQGSSKA
jgi:NAD(P)H-hydrate epimerase